MNIGPTGAPTAVINKLLIANRGEIAVRITRTAAEMGIATVAIYPQDDKASLHVRRAGDAYSLPGRGAQAYLDSDAIIKAALASGSDALHPGYGFLAESAEFAEQVEAAGIRFIGPTSHSLRLFGDKVAARQHAQNLHIPIIPGTGLDSSLGIEGASELDQAVKFFKALPAGEAMLIKAVAGGGGRGMRVVNTQGEIAMALERCRSEAQAAFGNPAVYVEQYLPAVRHLEVQIIGDGAGECVALGERECSLQRRHQKIVEIAPSPSITTHLREQLTHYAIALTASDHYRSLGTVEFLLNTHNNELFFIETNPRIQVEHTVTEAVYGLDLVRLQLELAQGSQLTDIIPCKDKILPRGYAMQLRINMERMDAKGNTKPTGGLIDIYEPPSGVGIRVDGFAYSGYRSSSHYD
ncbi:MAG: ATP-grasp domain-containing protein, partial [Nitrospinaceae bacterium]|nr:ATP-grasp domain-containing protein [Nitrospinaceae bacterium]